MTPNSRKNLKLIKRPTPNLSNHYLSLARTAICHWHELLSVIGTNGIHTRAQYRQKNENFQFFRAFFTAESSVHLTCLGKILGFVRCKMSDRAYLVRLCESRYTLLFVIGMFTC